MKLLNMILTLHFNRVISWINLTSPSNVPSPGPRFGHTMDSWKDLDINKTYIVLFGGRGNDYLSFHEPKTFELVSVRGRLEISTYDQKILEQPSKNRKFGSTKLSNTSYLNYTESEIKKLAPVGLFYNDVWLYDVKNRTWNNLIPQTPIGECSNIDGVEVCKSPFSRYHHLSFVLLNQFLAIFGGLGPFCIDYCGDLWILPLNKTLLEENENKTGTKWIQKDFNFPKRWKMGGARVNHSHVFVFGGDDGQKFRNDLFVLDFSSCYCAPGSTNCLIIYESCIIAYSEPKKVKQCDLVNIDPVSTSLHPDIPWEERFEKRCYLKWPEKRSSFYMAASNSSIYVFGGYRTYEGYPYYKGAPVYEFWLNDLWSYEVKSGIWSHVESFKINDFSQWIWKNPNDNIVPSPREGGKMFYLQNKLILIGGINNDKFFNDYWLFDLGTKFWQKRTTLVSKNLNVRSVGYFSACLVEATGEIYLHGGQTLPQKATHKVEKLLKLSKTGAWNEFWVKPIHRCRNHCVGNGQCFFGVCHCVEGYTGVDCSNKSCPGSLCLFDVYMRETRCAECAAPIVSASENGMLGALKGPNSPHYVAYNQKYAFSHYRYFLQYPSGLALLPTNYSEYKLQEYVSLFSNGQCDGNTGSCLCNAGFSGRDCSIQINNCKNNCSFKGFCALDHLSSKGRCVCDYGFYGTSCELKKCLHNCSYPRGVCNATTGTCNCFRVPDPYKNTRLWRKYQGLDCSYMIPYAGGHIFNGNTYFSILVLTILHQII
eukprot:snap_masked-scaffold_20-processed-gene-5.83-mRNA-1 protein AED:1.00 eAED:1.00 QI:0/0/0/0/1/1/3/0/763